MSDINDRNSRLILWMRLLNAETEEDLAEIEKAGVPEINKAVAILRELSADEEFREMAERREKEILEEQARINSSEEKVADKPCEKAPKE